MNKNNPESHNEKVEDLQETQSESNPARSEDTDEFAIDEAQIDAELNQQIALKQQQIANQRAQIKAENQQFGNLELAELDNDESLDTQCLNCKTPLVGNYCHECGQPERHFIRFFPKVLWDMINEAFDLDSKVFRTIMPLMFSPGRLTLEYITGRRARYVNPLRLYIITSILFFIVLTLTTDFDSVVTVNEASAEKGIKSRVTVEEEAPVSPIEGAGSELEKSASSKDSATSGSSAVDKQLVREYKQAIAALKAKKARGMPIDESQIKQLENALISNNLDRAELVNIDDKDDLNINLGNGSWHPETNPLKFNGWFSPVLTAELNDYLWSLKAKARLINDDPGRFIEEILNVIPQLMFVLLPLFALFLKIIYLFKKRYYMEHLIVALHSHSFIFLSLLFILLFQTFIDDYLVPESWQHDLLGFLTIALIIWLPVNLYLQQKRIYAQGHFMTFVKFAIVGVCYSMLLGGTTVIAAILGLVAL